MANNVARKPSQGARLQELREWRGFTQKGLAKAVGISEPEVSRIESGERKKLNANLAMALCRELKCEMRFLLEGTGRPWLPGWEIHEKVPMRDGRRKEMRAVAPEKKRESGEHRFGQAVGAPRRVSSLPPGSRR